VKRLLVLLPGAFDSIGGIQTYNRLLIKACSDLLTDDRSTCEVLILNDRPGTADSRYFDSRNTRVRAFSRSKWRFIASALLAVVRRRPDVLITGHVHFAPLTVVLGLLSPRSERWFITHGVDVWVRLSAVTRFALSRADRVLSVSDYTRRELIRCNDLRNGNCELLYNALDPLWCEESGGSNHPSIFPPQPVMLTCARMHPADRFKGIDQTIRALPRLLESIPDLRYVVVGDGEDRGELEKLAQQMGVSSHVEFKGNLSRSELAEAYRSCSVFVMPSRKEGFGIVFLEAAFFGKPSIGGAHGGTPEVIEEGSTGWLVQNGDHEQLAKVLTTILQDHDTITRAGAAARARLHERFLFKNFRDSLGTMLGVRT
jgi:glycosyltransferase involved in cell wall biosynthesis